MELIAFSSFKLPTKRFNPSVWKDQARRLWVEIGHRGIDPCYNRATHHLYTVELRKQIEAVQVLFQNEKQPTLLAKIQFILRTNTRKLKRYSKDHALELNENQTEILPSLYAWIYTVNQTKISLLRWNPNRIIGDLAAELELKSFKLLSSLGRASLSSESKAFASPLAAA